MGIREAKNLLKIRLNGIDGIKVEVGLNQLIVNVNNKSVLDKIPNSMAGFDVYKKVGE